MNCKLYLLLPMLLIGACNEQVAESDQGKSAIEKQLSTQLDALEKAKDTEQVLQDAADKRRKILEERESN